MPTPIARPPKKSTLSPTAPPLHPFDDMHGVDTGDLIPATRLLTGHPSDAHVTAYYGVAPSILRTLIERWLEVTRHPIDQYTFIDIGAGKGRAMLVASQLPFRHVLGVELNPTLASIARQNITHFISTHTADPTAPPLSTVELLERDALTLQLPTSPTLLFLFHPFEAPLLKQLLRQIETQLARVPGAILDILYVNAECASTLDLNPAFIRLWLGSVHMSPEDHAAEIALIATQKEYGSTGDEECAIYRYIGRSRRASSPTE